MLAGVPAGDVVVLDGLVCSDRPCTVRPEVGRLRLVVLVHLPLALEPSSSKRPQTRSREAEVLRAVHAVVTTSRWSRQWLVDAYGLDPAWVSVAVPGAERGALARGSPGGRHLLCVGAVVPAKGHDVLLEALARVSVGDWRLEVVGTRDRDPGFAARLRERAAALGLAERVSFTGPLVGSDLAAAYARADLLVSTSRLETYGMVVTEALAHGLPVLATRVGGVPQALGRVPGGGRPGILVPVDDVGAVVGWLERWFGDPALRGHLREAAVERRESLPTWRSTSAEVARVLARVTAGGEPVGGPARSPGRTGGPEHG